MILTLTGENTFAIAAAERQLVAAFAQKHGANSIERVDAEAITPARLPDLLQGATLFAPSRLVIIKNLAANKPLLEPLADALPLAADEITVVIAEPAPDKRTKLYKFLQKKSTFKQFAVLDGAQLVKWLQEEAVRLGGQIGTPEARRLAERVGNDQWRLANELEKLVSYQATVSAEAIDLLVEPNPEGTAFELLDAALSGDRAAITRLIGVLRPQEDPYKLFGLLSSQVYAIAVVAVAGTRSPDTIAKETGLHPFVVRKTQGVAKRLGRARAAQLAADVARCDMQLKSTGADPWDLLQLCLQKIAP